MDEEPFTPTTSMIRDDYAYYGESSPAGTIEESKAEFDRWLEHIRREAWQQGYEAGQSVMPDSPLDPKRGRCRSET